MHRWLLLALWLCAAQPAAATSFVLVFDGVVDFTVGSAPSLVALGLSNGSPLHYEVAVERDGDGVYLDGDGTVVPQPDVWNAPDDHQDTFYAELLAQPYETPGSWLGFGREFFVGVDVVSPAFPDCAVLGRLFVGTELFAIDGCAPVADWSEGLEVGSWHQWQDPVTGEQASVFGSLAVTEVMPLPEPDVAGLLAAVGLALAAARLSRRSGAAAR